MLSFHSNCDDREKRSTDRGTLSVYRSRRLRSRGLEAVEDSNSITSLPVCNIHIERCSQVSRAISDFRHQSNSRNTTTIRNESVPKIIINNTRKYVYILALEMASPWNQHCANCIGTLSFPIVSDWQSMTSC